MPQSKPDRALCHCLQESEWEKDKVYDEDPPSCVHYFIEWRVTLNNKAVTNRMLDDRDAQLYAEENACGRQAIWRYVYDLMKCDSPACHLGPYCWLDPVGKKHYGLRTRTLKRLVTNAEKGGILETHKDVPDEIKEGLHLEEQQRQEKDKSKKGKNHLSTSMFCHLTPMDWMQQLPVQLLTKEF